QDQLDLLIKVIRKGIHLSFYGTLTYFFASYLFPKMSSQMAVYIFAIALPLLIAISDEYRQSMMVNRQGSIMDVFLDMSATFVVLFLFYWIARKKEPALASSSENH
ncbi:MAG: VanZ family protein, partial [Armatimonadota bacterium]